MNIVTNIEVFKDYCEGLLSPCYIKEYVSKLLDYEYDRFYKGEELEKVKKAANKK